MVHLKTYFNGGNDQARVFNDIAVPVPEIDEGGFAAPLVNGLLAAVVCVIAAGGREFSLVGVVVVVTATTAFHLQGPKVC